MRKQRLGGICWPSRVLTANENHSGETNKGEAFHGNTFLRKKHPVAPGLVGLTSYEGRQSGGGASIGHRLEQENDAGYTGSQEQFVPKIKLQPPPLLPLSTLRGGEMVVVGQRVVGLPVLSGDSVKKPRGGSPFA